VKIKQIGGKVRKCEDRREEERRGEISGFRRRRDGSLHLVVVDREGGDLPVCMLEVP